MSTRGNHILNYHIKRVLGKGGMGTVYLATHNTIGHKVAIKELKPQFAQDASIRQRFRNEAALMANLRHPNIVSLHDYVETPQGVYLIMEYVEGIPLDQYIHKVSGPIPKEKAIDIFLKILSAFAYAHERNVVHRDIKPSNVMVTGNGDIKILDFGIAKNIDPGNRQLTQTGIRLGTIFYMSPEQVRAKELDARSDIYSLGITFFEMLTGNNPYESDLSEYDISLKIVNEPLPKARDFYPGVSDTIQRILEKATAKKAEDRFQNVEEFKEALRGDREVGALSANRDNTVEWIIQSQQNAGESLIDENTLYKKEKEYLILDNSFGIVSNKKTSFFKGKDLFEKGKKEEIYIRKLLSVDIKTHREISTAIFFIVLAIPWPVFYFSIASLITCFLILLFAGLCFAKFPTVVIVKQDMKKIMMKGWPWHIRAASEYVYALQEQIGRK